MLNHSNTYLVILLPFHNASFTTVICVYEHSVRRAFIDASYQGKRIYNI